MSRRARTVTRRACAVTRGERGIRAVIAVFVGAFALNQLEQPWYAVPAGAAAVLVAIGAITGWCPPDLLGRARAETEPNALGYPEARQPLVP